MRSPPSKEQCTRVYRAVQCDYANGRAASPKMSQVLSLHEHIVVTLRLRKSRARLTPCAQRFRLRENSSCFLFFLHDHRVVTLRLRKSKARLTPCAQRFRLRENSSCFLLPTCHSDQLRWGACLSSPFFLLPKQGGCKYFSL